MKPCDIGLVGLAVMGQNLVLNMERNGFSVAVYNRTETTTAAFMEGPGAGKNISAAFSLGDLSALLKKPRKIVLMVKAGLPVDKVIADLKPLLEPGDLILDGGNSFFLDTERRSRDVEEANLQYMGAGISGGEEGALLGASIMPGGSRGAYDLVKPIFTAISARVNGDPCVAYIGPRGAGHYVKMVHNAIEYGDMQLIAEAYDLLHRGLKCSPEELHEIFVGWNEGVLSSYLIEITADIFSSIDGETGKPLLDMILDQARQKGTGRWASQNALEIGVPIPTLTAAVDARILSAYKLERVEAARHLSGPGGSFSGDRRAFINEMEQALYAAKICSYAQGMALLRGASRRYEYGLDYGEIARIWRGGCIIRARLLDDIRAAFAKEPGLPNLLMDPYFKEAVISRQTAWRHVVETAIRLGIPAPALSASLAYFDGYRSSRLPANLTQAQRDYFGAHTYERLDREGIFHTE